MKNYKVTFIIDGKPRQVYATQVKDEESAIEKVKQFWIDQGKEVTEPTECLDISNNTVQDIFI